MVMEFAINRQYVNVKKDTQEQIVHKLHVKIIVIIMEYVKIRNVNVLKDFKEVNVRSQRVLINVQYKFNYNF
jgi:hypothetical protein